VSSGPGAAVRVWSLELRELRPARTTADVRRAAVPFGPLNAFFYAEVGRPFGWTDRAGWPPERWQAWAERVETWLVHDRGTPAGYAELDPRGDRVELAYFGLLAPFRGRGLGGALLTAAVRRALELAPLVTVSTNERDGEHALANYRARGFEVVRERQDLLQCDSSFPHHDDVGDHG
jgi:ribosomal protein S18 acetylase RimI-like enzyme